MKKGQKHILNLYMNDTLIGSLILHVNGSLELMYNTDYLQAAESIPISRSLPLQEESYTGSVVYNYFDNLLPDNQQIRQIIAQKTQADSTGVFDILWNIGRDCVGAIQFIPAGQEVEQKSLEGVAIADDEIEKKLIQLKQFPLGINEDDDFRISIAGAQEKTAFLYKDNKWHVPKGSTPTTHIFKTAMGVINSDIDMSLSIENEWLCLKICKEFGLNVAEAEIHQFNSVKSLVVKRFDRMWSKDETFIYRIPQEDFCQVLGYSSTKKYENDGGPSINAIMEILNESNERDLDRNDFFKIQIIFFLLAAIDGHAKNFSVKWSPLGFELTPMYDVMSAHPLVASGRFQKERMKLAMAVGESRHYKLDKIFRGHWLEMAKITKFPKESMESLIDEIIVQTPEVCKKIQSKLPKGFPAVISDPILSGMLKNLSHLRNVEVK